MDVREYLLSLAGYSAWADERVFAAAESLTAEQFAATPGGAYTSVRGNLLHVLGATAIWLSRWSGAPPHPAFRPDALVDVASIREASAAVASSQRQFLTTLSAGDLDRPLAYTATTGKSFERPLGDTVMQVLAHGIHHRGEVAMALTTLGHSPGDIDYIFFTFARDRPAP